MASTKTNPKLNPWGKDNPEIIRDQALSPSQTRQAGSLLNPLNMIDQLFGKSWEGPKPPEKEVRTHQSHTYQEMVLFMYSDRNKEINVSKEMHEIKTIIDTLKKQVKILEKSEKSLVSEVTKIKVEQLPQKPGVYYIRFFEWLISLVRQLRAKVEEGRTWLQAMTTKKKKMGYWKMYKKHGTTFGLSHERTLATQSG